MKKKDTSNLDSIGNRIRYLRMLTGLDRNHMEMRHQVKKVSLVKWENGTANISPRNITRLINVAIDIPLNAHKNGSLQVQEIPLKQLPLQQ